MKPFNVLTIVIGTTRRNRAQVVDGILAWKTEGRRQARAVVGYTTGAPTSERDAELFRLVTEDRFARMERSGEFAHVDELDGVRHGYRFADIEEAVNECDAIVVLHEFDEPVDRASLAPIKCAKRVVDPDNKTQKLTRTSYGHICMRDGPAN